jgi:hypothetical protein
MELAVETGSGEDRSMIGSFRASVISFHLFTDKTPKPLG